MGDDKTKVFSAMRARTQENIARQKAAEYTPTTDAIRESHAFTVQSKIAGGTFGQGLAEFDRWLKAHDAAVRADMQREVQTVEELDALPVGTVFMNVQRQSAAWEVVSEETDGTDIRYMSTGNVEFFQSKTLVNGGPFTILFTPSTPNQTGAGQ